MCYDEIVGEKVDMPITASTTEPSPGFAEPSSGFVEPPPGFVFILI